jgi:sulfur-oxidizing protein SoxY
MRQSAGMTRRDVIAAAAGAAGSGLLPSWALATPEQMAAEIARVLAGRTAKPGRIKLDLPTISENGGAVPLGFEVQSPMTAADHVTAVHIFADGNPSPLVATYRFSPLMPKAAMQLRIRLAQTQLVTVMAELSTGEVHMVQQDAKVTLGGCGG